MAYTGVLVTLSGIKILAGENVDATGMDDEHAVNLLVSMAEQNASLLGKYDFVANVGTLTALGKEVLAEYCGRSVAMSLIAFNTAGFSSLQEAEDMINIHLYRIRNIEKLISDQNYVKQITGV